MSIKEKRTKVVRKKQQSISSDYKKIFESHGGKNVLWDLMKFTGFLGPSHVIGDSHTTAFNDGQKATVLHILKTLKYDQEKLQKQIDRGIEDDHELFAEM
jgi:hypothetical protein